MPAPAELRPLPPRSRLPLLVLGAVATVVVVGGLVLVEGGGGDTVAAGAGMGLVGGAGSTSQTPSVPPSASDGAAPAASDVPDTVADGGATSGTASSSTSTPAGSTVTTGPGAVQLRTASADEPYLVVVGGDSLAGAPAWSLEELVADDPTFEVVTDFRVSTGVVRSDFFDWLGHVQTLRDRHDPDVVVLAMGANDLQSFPGGPGSPLTDEWLAHYGERVGQMLDELQGRLVVWIGLPPMGMSWLVDAIVPINGAVRPEVEARSWARYVDLFPAFADGKGRFVTHAPGVDGEVVRLRRDDGVHYTGSGGDVVARLVLDAIEAAAPPRAPTAPPT